MADQLARELATFESNRAKLLGEGAGRFVLIKGDDVIGLFDTQADALSAGFAQFGNAPFFVRQITAADVPLNFVTVGLGL